MDWGSLCVRSDCLRHTRMKDNGLERSCDTVIMGADSLKDQKKLLRELGCIQCRFRLDGMFRGFWRLPKRFAMDNESKVSKPQ